MRRFRVFIVAFLVATFVISMPARDGMAIMQIPYNTVVYGPLDIGGLFGLPVVEGVGVCAHDKYAAAMTALGYGGDVVTGLDSDKKALLSNQSTGGAFWTFAQHFVNPSPNGNLTERMVYRYAELYGTGVVWSAEYQASEKASAIEALETVLNGGSVGGGGTESGDYFVFGKSDLSLVDSFSNVTISKSQILSNISDSGIIKDGFCCFRYSSSTGSTLYVTLILVMSGNVYDASSNTDVYNVFVSAGTKYYLVQLNNCTYQLNGDSLSINLSRNLNLRDTNFSEASGDMQLTSVNRNSHWWGYMRDAVSSPVLPPTNWPDAPEVTPPSAPDVPTPSEPDLPTQPSTPTAPTLPDFPSNVIVPGTTYETFDIQAILDAMDEHCQHLQSAIYQGFADYFDTFTPWLDERLETLQACIRGESVWQIQRIDADFESLKDYLHDLFEWLADQMQFTFSGDSYDDSSVISWLRRIYFKLQSSPVNTRPADPVANPDDSWDWLWQLLQDILNGLTGGAAELVGKLMTLFDGIKDKFPFSVPWDLAAVLALLDVPAQTPAFVVSYDVFGTTVTYDIDLHFMDEYAEVIRSMESVLFCFMLIKNTKWLTGIFDEVGQFLGTKLGYRG